MKSNKARAIILIIIGVMMAVITYITIELSVPAALIIGAIATITLAEGIGNLKRG